MVDREKNGTNGMGLWVAFHKLLDYDKFLEEAKDAGASWIALRSGDGGGLDQSIPPMNQAIPWDSRLRGLVDKIHKAGLKAYTWHYTRPGSQDKQVLHVKRCFDNGVDGHCLNAEIEWESASSVGYFAKTARSFGELLRKSLPKQTIFHAPLGWFSYHYIFPYTAFSEFCDEVHPQMYWTELKQGKYEPSFVRELASWEEANADGKIVNRVRQGSTVVASGPNKVAPIGVLYGKNSNVFKASKRGAPIGTFQEKDLEDFIARCTSHKSFSFYSADAGQENLKILGKLMRKYKMHPGQRIAVPTGFGTEPGDNCPK